MLKSLSFFQEDFRIKKTGLKEKTEAQKEHLKMPIRFSYRSELLDPRLEWPILGQDRKNDIAKFPCNSPYGDSVRFSSLT